MVLALPRPLAAHKRLAVRKYWCCDCRPVQRTNCAGLFPQGLLERGEASVSLPILSILDSADLDHLSDGDASLSGTLDDIPDDFNQQ